MKAVLGVLDQERSELGTILADPIRATTLSEIEWQAAEAARAAVEQNLRGLAVEAAVLVAQATDWRSKAALAEHRGDTQLAEQARVRAAEVEQTYRSYTQEMSAVRAFLQEWAVRVTRASSTPAAGER
jgi:phage shock protein A